MTRKIYSAVMAGAAVLAATAGATSANAATASSPARARVVSAITLTHDSARPLDFGAIVPTAAAGSVTIDAASNSRTACTSAACSGAVSSSLFNITTGTAGEIIVVNADASVTLTSGLNTMTASLVESASTVTLNSSGAGSFTVGGTLSVGASQAQGTYTGNFNVTADYQ